MTTQRTEKRKPPVLHAAIVLVLALFPVSNSAAAEDLTTFDEHFEKNRRMTPIGPLGILTRFLTPQSLRVDEIIEGSPADGVLEKEDVIVAANGKTFEGEPVGPYPALLMKLAEQIEESQGNPALNGKFSLAVIREGKEMTIDFQIERLGYYGDTFPFDCAKSDRVLKTACDYVASTQLPDGSWGDYREKHYATGASGLALLASGDPKYEENIERAVDYVMKNLRTGADPGGFSGWYLTYAGMFLGEYHLATGCRNPEIMDKLKEIYRTLRMCQFSFGGKYKKWYDNGGYHWGHETDYTDKYGGYLSMGPVTSGALTIYGLMQESGTPIDKLHIYRTIKSVSTSGGDFPYDGPGAAYGRTGLGAIGLCLLDDQSEFKGLVGKWLGNEEVTLGGRYFRTHYMPVMGKTWGQLGTHMINPEAYRRVMDFHKWEFLLGRGFDGNFYRNTNFTNYAYYWPSKKVVNGWISWGHPHFNALCFSTSTQCLRVTGGKVTILGVVKKRLSPSLKAVFELLEEERYEEASKLLASAEGPEKERIQAYIGNRARHAERLVDELLSTNDVYGTVILAETLKSVFGDLCDFKTSRIKADADAMAIARRFHEVLSRPPTTSHRKLIADLGALSTAHPDSPYAVLAREFMHEREAHERFPQEWLAILQEFAQGRIAMNHEETNIFSVLDNNLMEFESLYGEDEDYKDAIGELQACFLTHAKAIKAYKKLTGELMSSNALKKPGYKEYVEQRVDRFLKDYPDSPFTDIVTKRRDRYANFFRTGGRTSDEAATGISELEKLRHLHLSVTDFSAAGLEQLQSLHSLEYLDLATTRVTADKMDLLKPFTSLKHLFLTRMTDDGVGDLAALDLPLVTLSLDSSRNVTDTALRPVGKIKTLQHLDLRRCAVTGEGLASLKNTPLTTLGLSKCPLTSKGVRNLRHLKSLSYLDLSFTKVQDDDLKALHGLGDLRFLDLTGTDVSREAVDALMTAVSPELVVEEPFPYVGTMIIKR